MRGTFRNQAGLFSYLSLEERVPERHPLRNIRELVRAVLVDMTKDFAALYSDEGRPSIPPERLLSALLLQAFYGLRSERQLMEQLDYNLLFRWFVGLSPDAPVWVPTTFTKNRERLQDGDVFQRFMQTLLNHPRVKPLLSDEHFSVDGTLIEAWASFKSFKPKDGSEKSDGSDFHNQRRSNETHASQSDPDSRLYRKAQGREAKLCYMGHALMENRNGLAVGAQVTLASGTAEREASEAMLGAKTRETGKAATVGEDKAYDAEDHGKNLREMNVTPHVAQNNATTKAGKQRKTIVDDATAAGEAYGISQKRRKMIECLFGWGKQHGTMRKTKHRGMAAVAGDFLINIIAYNLIRIPQLLVA
jgi:transposase